MKKITMVQYGCGKMSKYTMRYALEQGIKLVGAFDIDESKIGKDAGLVTGEKKYNVKIQHAKDFEEFLKAHEVDVVIVTTTSLVGELEDVLTICARNESTQSQPAKRRSTLKTPIQKSSRKLINLLAKTTAQSLAVAIKMFSGEI